MLEALALRHEVFCREQGVPEFEELDGRDAEGIHLVAIADGELVIERVPKTTPFDGWWLPMSGRQDGPAFGEYDQFMAVRSSNGQRGGAVAAQGNLRTLH